MSKRDEETTYREGVKETLHLILAQTTKTNGRVSNLEENSLKMQIWRGRIVGGLTVLSFIVSAMFVPIAIILLNHGHAI